MAEMEPPKKNQKESLMAALAATLGSMVIGGQAAKIAAEHAEKAAQAGARKKDADQSAKGGKSGR